jgi:hypothetical protein
MRIENQKSGKLRLNPHGTILEGKSIDEDPKKRKSENGFGEPRCKLGSQGMVQLKDPIFFFFGGFN